MIYRLVIVTLALLASMVNIDSCALDFVHVKGEGDFVYDATKYYKIDTCINVTCDLTPKAGSVLDFGRRMPCRRW